MNQIFPNHLLAGRDDGIIALIASLKAAWENAPTGPTTVDEQALRAYMVANFDEPAKELEAMRPATVAEALAKVRFYLWFADAVGSDEPYERGLRIAAEDLETLAAAEHRDIVSGEEDLDQAAHIFADGKRAGRNGDAAETNPHSEDNSAANLWERGRAAGNREPAAVPASDPDAELKRLWVESVRLEHEFEHAPFSGTEEERAQQYQHMSEALDKAFAAEAHTVTGLSIKLQQVHEGLGAQL